MSAKFIVRPGESNDTVRILRTGSEVAIDMEAQEAYLRSVGVDTSEMSEQEIKEADTADKVFLMAKVKILDAIEDITLDFAI